jgi:murein DD-endopeptidase MepM/ murein hydrolase activator NlpD
MLKRFLLGAFLAGIIFGAHAQAQTAFTRLADGFDFPIGKPDGRGYYKARGFRPNGHLGEDWDGLGGGNTDLRDPVYSIGDGVVVFARDVHLGWGNVVIVRHVFREAGSLRTIDALYGHLNNILVRVGQRVMRGQQLATIGTAHGVYDAHLHFEIRKNIAIGMNRAAFRRDFSNYYDPSKFLLTHRRLKTARTTYPIAMNTFTHDAKYNVDGLRNFHRRSRSTSQSSAALKRALASRR